MFALVDLGDDEGENDGGDTGGNHDGEDKIKEGGFVGGGGERSRFFDFFLGWFGYFAGESRLNFSVGEFSGFTFTAELLHVESKDSEAGDENDDEAPDDDGLRAAHEANDGAG